MEPWSHDECSLGKSGEKDRQGDDHQVSPGIRYMLWCDGDLIWCHSLASFVFLCLSPPALNRSVSSTHTLARTTACRQWGVPFLLHHHHQPPALLVTVHSAHHPHRYCYCQYLKSRLSHGCHCSRWLPACTHPQHPLLSSLLRLRPLRPPAIASTLTRPASSFPRRQTPRPSVSPRRHMLSLPGHA